MLQNIIIGDSQNFISRVGKVLSNINTLKKRHTQPGQMTLTTAQSPMEKSQEQFDDNLYYKPMPGDIADDKLKYRSHITSLKDELIQHGTSSFVSTSREYQQKLLNDKTHIGPCKYSPRFKYLQSKSPEVFIAQSMHRKKRSITSISICKELM